MSDQFPHRQTDSESPYAAYAQSTALEQQDHWRTYLDMALRWWWVIVLSALLAAGAAALVSYNQTSIYRTTAKLLINQASSSNDVYQDILTSERIAETYAQWMNQRIVIEDTMAELGLSTDPGVINQQITSVNATPLRSSQIIELAVEGPNRELIVAFARTLPQVFSDWAEEVQTSRYAETRASLTSRMESLSRQIETTQNQLDAMSGSRSGAQELEYNRLAEELSRLRTSHANLAETFEELQIQEARSVDTIAVIEEAETPSAPVRPTPLRNLLIGLILGGAGAVGLVLLYESYVDRFRSQEEMRQLLGLPALGSIFRVEEAGADGPSSLVALHNARSVGVEAFRRLRTNLRFADIDHELKSLAVASANSEEGKSFISANLAVIMAQAGLRVILVDTDLRKPKLHKFFGLSRSPGLTDALYHVAESSAGPVSQDIPARGAVPQKDGGPDNGVGPTDSAVFLSELGSFDNLDALLQPTELDTLRVLPVGRRAPNPTELLGSRRMAHLISYLETQADLVIFDTPPVLAVSDAQVIGAQVGGTLLVIDPNRTTRKMARHALEALAQVNVRVAGLTVNRIPPGRRGYSYYPYYDYYEEDDSLGETGAHGAQTGASHGDGSDDGSGTQSVAGDGRRKSRA